MSSAPVLAVASSRGSNASSSRVTNPESLSSSARKSNSSSISVRSRSASASSSQRSCSSSKNKQQQQEEDEMTATRNNLMKIASAGVQMRHVPKSHFETSKVRDFPVYSKDVYRQNLQAAAGDTNNNYSNNNSYSESPRNGAPDRNPVRVFDKAMSGFQVRHVPPSHFITSQQSQFKGFTREQQDNARPVSAEQTRNSENFDYYNSNSNPRHHQGDSNEKNYYSGVQMRHVPASHFRTSKEEQFQKYDSKAYVSSSRDGASRQQQDQFYYSLAAASERRNREQQKQEQKNHPLTSRTKSSSSSRRSSSSTSNKNNKNDDNNNNSKNIDASYISGYSPRHVKDPNHWISQTKSAFPVYDVKKIVRESRETQSVSRGDQGSSCGRVVKKKKSSTRGNNNNDGHDDNDDGEDYSVGYQVRHVPASHFETATKAQFPVYDIAKLRKQEQEEKRVNALSEKRSRFGLQKDDDDDDDMVTRGYQPRHAPPEHWITSSKAQFKQY